MRLSLRTQSANLYIEYVVVIANEVWQSHTKKDCIEFFPNRKIAVPDY
jgi:hypothetical protein